MGISKKRALVRGLEVGTCGRLASSKPVQGVRVLTRTVDQLKAEFTDVEWRRKYVEFCDLVEILVDSTIADDYVVPDEFNSAIKLTDAGNALLDRLSRKEKVNAKDARLMCALTLGHEDLFVDISAIDIERFAQVINSGLSNGSLLFPFIFGRQLYDTFAELFEDEKETLTNDETLKLISRLPKGVFQYGAFTVGPFGLQRSLTNRNVRASRRIAAYHCAVPTCHVVHPVALQTGYNASINRGRDKLEPVLQARQCEPSEWWEFAASLSGLSDSYYGDQRAGVLLPLVGDALSDPELRLLVADVLDSTKGELRAQLSSFLEVRSAVEAVGSLDRAQMLQILLIGKEEWIATSLDKLVRLRAIELPKGEIRKPVINRRLRSGAFRLRAELGQHGVRFVSDDAGLALLRQRRMLGRLYLREPEADVQELEWQLRGINVDDLDEKLEHFFQTRSPVEAIERLVLARRSNMITACHEVGLEPDDGAADAELVAALLWKLGFSILEEGDPHAEFWQRHERVWALTQSSSIGNSDRFMEAAAPYFSGLEGLLLDSLAFTSWALLVDHTRNEMPFSYDNESDRAEGLALLQAASEGTLGEANQYLPDYSAERVELRGLVDAFRTLAKHLDECRRQADTYVRPREEFPAYDGKTDLKKFMFRSTLPFLDLSRPSQDRIIEGLTELSQSLVEAEVFSVRNDYAHYRRNAPDVARVEKALEAIRQSVAKIENLGFARLLYVPTAVQTDRWGQARHDFSGPRSSEHTFTRPTNLDWMGLPELDEPQYLVRSASFGDPNEVLRFTRRYQSEFSRMWLGVPNRRRNRTASLENSEQPSSTDQTDAGIVSG